MLDPAGFTNTKRAFNRPGHGIDPIGDSVRLPRERLEPKEIANVIMIETGFDAVQRQSTDRIARQSTYLNRRITVGEGVIASTYVIG